MTRRAWTAFAVMSVVWGLPYLLIKLAVDDRVPPAGLAWARVLLAAIVLSAAAVRTGALRSLRGRLGWVSAFAVVEIALPLPLIAVGEQHVPSSLAAIVIATVPLIIALLALRFDAGERPTRGRMSGLILGFVGVVALVGVDGSGDANVLLGMLAILVAAIGYAIGPMILKHRLTGVDPVATMAASMAVASLLLAPAAVITAPSAAPGVGALAAIIALGLVCTALAFVVYNVLINEVGPSRASVITYINPIVALAAGVGLLHERPGAGALTGLLLILAGSWLATGGRLPSLPLFSAASRRR